MAKKTPYKASFENIKQLDVPQSRNGKHRKIISSILSDIEHLTSGSALKVPLAALGASKEKVRAALSRECKKRKLIIATAADEQHLYLWRH